MQTGDAAAVSGLGRIDASDLDVLVAQARLSPRRRQHLNLHAGHDEPCQRLLNAVCEDSYIRPHRHPGYSTNECLIALRGRFVVVHFNDEGGVTGALPFGHGEATLIVEIEPRLWHTVIALTEGSILFETKSGPFSPTLAKAWAPWAPEEGSPDAPGYLLRLGEIARSLSPSFHVRSKNN